MDKAYYFNLFKKMKSDFFKIFPKEYFSDNVISERLVFNGFEFERSFKMKSVNKKFEKILISQISNFKYMVEVIKKETFNCYSFTSYPSELKAINATESFLKPYEKWIYKFIEDCTEIPINEIQVHYIEIKKSKDLFKIHFSAGGVFQKICDRYNGSMHIAINKDYVILQDDIKMDKRVFRRNFYVKNFKNKQKNSETLKLLEKSKLEFIDDYINLLKMELC